MESSGSSLSNRKNSKSNLVFVEFLPTGMEDDQIVSASRRYTSKVLQALLDLPDEQFLEVVSNDSSFDQLLTSYTANRDRPVILSGKSQYIDNQEITIEIDRLFVLIALRTLTCYDLQATADNIYILKPEILADICAIIGDSNVAHARLLLSTAYDVLPNFGIHVFEYFKEVLVAIQDVFNEAQTLRTPKNDDESDTGTGGRPGSNKSSGFKKGVHLRGPRKYTTDRLQRGLEKAKALNATHLSTLDVLAIRDLAIFAADISLSIAAFLGAIPLKAWEKWRFFAPGGSSLYERGKDLLLAFRMIHDDVGCVLEACYELCMSAHKESNYDICAQIANAIFVMRNRSVHASGSIFRNALALAQAPTSRALSSTGIVDNGNDSGNGKGNDDGNGNGNDDGNGNGNDDGNGNGNDNGNDDRKTYSWIDTLQSLVWPSGPPEGIASSHRVFIADVVKVHKNCIRDLLEDYIGEDIESVDYFLSAAAATEPSPIWNSHVYANNNTKAMHIEAFSNAAEKKRPDPKAAFQPTAEQTQSAMDLEKVKSVRTVFPNLGEGFLFACLQCFEMSVDRTIDAILTENLPPAVASMNRHEMLQLERLTLKAKSDVQQMEISRENENYKKLELQRIRAEQEAAERDRRLLLTLATEYADDYDDQYDDVYSSEVGHSTPNGDDKPEINWASANQDDIRRVNTLIREKEAEAAFWESMRNTNHLSGNVEEAEEAAQTAAATAANANANASVRGRKAKNQGMKPDKSFGGGDVKATTTTEEGKKKFRTKKFDKHHQKDKSLKKMG